MIIYRPAAHYVNLVNTKGSSHCTKYVTESREHCGANNNMYVCKQHYWISLILFSGIIRSFFTGRGPAYSGPQLRDHITIQCACPGRGRELVGVYNLCVSNAWGRRVK